MTANELVLSHISYADQIACTRRRNLPPCVQLDELKSAAYMGLVDAANKYQDTLCDNFKAYASFRINGAIQDYLRELGWGTRKDAKSHKTLEQDVPSAPKASGELMAKIGKSMTSQRKQVLEGYFMQDKTQQEIGEEMGLSKARICQILSESCDHIRSTWSQEELWEEVA
jgi:RNA polymerase sigma factor (sigma-70 family)